MKLSRRSMLARVYFWGHRRITTDVIPESVSLCNLIGYVGIGLPLALVATGVIFGCVWPLIWVVNKIDRLMSYLWPRTFKPTGSLHAIQVWLLSKKRRVCPLIEWSEP